MPDLDVSIQPETKGAEALARQIKQTGRAYPLFDIAHLILKKPERYVLVYSVNRKPDGQVSQPLLLCNLDETLWLSEQEAVDHVLSRHFATFYQVEKIPTEPPKGHYTFVAQCGLSGIILGPPNYHDYQTKLLRLHAERFSHMPFEIYKARVKIVRDEAVVKQWLDEQSYRTEFVCLNVSDTVKLSSREDVERHFRETHLPNVIQPVETYTLTALAARSLPCRRLQALVRRTQEEQRRFPLRVVTTLSHQFASNGLHFFKVNKTVTHVCAARPRYLDLSTTAVSEGVKAIIDFIDSHPKSTRRQLVEVLAPSTRQPNTTTEIRVDAVEKPAPTAIDTPAPTPPSESSAAPPVAATPAPPSPEVAVILGNLHWLMHEGHVIEFANGILETAKKPAARPAKPQPSPETQTAPSAELSPAESSTATESEAIEPAPALSEPEPVQRTEPMTPTAPMDEVPETAPLDTQPPRDTETDNPPEERAPEHFPPSPPVA
jgi:hypothetical protein